jgi:hypothetical protein
MQNMTKSKKHNVLSSVDQRLGPAERPDKCAEAVSPLAPAPRRSPTNGPVSARGDLADTRFEIFVFICVHLCFHCFVATGTAGDGQADFETQMNTNEHK